MFVVKTHRHHVGEPREFVSDLYGPFEAWGAASEYADAFCHLWREERATASIECLYEPSDVILETARRQRHEALEKAFEAREAFDVV